MIILLSVIFINGFPKIAFSEQDGKEIAGQSVVQNKQSFVDSIMKEIKAEMEEYAKNNNGKVPYE
jgi:hypothetical protein